MGGWFGKPAGQQRTIVRAPRGEEFGLALGGVLIGIAAVTGLAGQLAALATGAGWPSWRGTHGNVLVPVIGVYAHAGQPMRDWPGLPPGQAAPAAWVYWPIYTLLLAGLVVGVVVVLRAVLGRRGRPGFASRREVADRMGTGALLKQASRLRPALVRTTPRPLPPQLGTSLGRDVNTGVEIWSSVRQSKYVVGPSESGKTSAVVIPEALDFDGHLINASSRADVMAATWKSRADRGRCLLFDPLRTAPALPLVRWPGLVTACTDPATAMRRAQDLIAGVDMSGVSNGDAWKSRGQAVLRNLLHAAALDHKDIRAVLRWAFDQTATEPAAILDRSPITPGNWAEMQYSVINLPDRQRAGYYMAIEGALEPFMHPAVLDATVHGTTGVFDPASFFDPSLGQQTLYLLSQVDQTVAVTGLLAALMSEITELARARGQRAENNRLDPPVKFLLDEAPNTGGAFGQLPSLISDGGGRGIPTTMVVQDRNQAIRRWGRDDAASMWGAATVRLVLPGVAGGEELREIASYVDNYDEEVASLTQAQHGNSLQYSLRDRAGMSAAEVRALPAFHGLVIAAGGLRPVETQLTPYFRRDDAAATAQAERDFYNALNEGRTV